MWVCCVSKHIFCGVCVCVCAFSLASNQQIECSKWCEQIVEIRICSLHQTSSKKVHKKWRNRFSCLFFYFVAHTCTGTGTGPSICIHVFMFCCFFFCHYKSTTFGREACVCKCNLLFMCTYEMLLFQLVFAPHFFFHSRHRISCTPTHTLFRSITRKRC